MHKIFRCSHLISHYSFLKINCREKTNRRHLSFEDISCSVYYHILLAIFHVITQRLYLCNTEFPAFGYQPTRADKRKPCTCILNGRGEVITRMQHKRATEFVMSNKMMLMTFMAQLFYIGMLINIFFLYF